MLFIGLQSSETESTEETESAESAEVCGAVCHGSRIHRASLMEVCASRKKEGASSSTHLRGWPGQW